MPNSSFRKSRLWAAITQKRSESSHADLIVSSAVPALTNTEILLRTAGTSPTDFTLHDADHAFRVAERMADIIPQDCWERLSLCESLLLLLSAYFHDIGMVPELGRVNAIHDYILTSEQSSLNEDEVNTLLDWVEQSASDGDTPTGEVALRHARELAAHYCRFRHNDWSEEWIRQNVTLDAMYGQCVDDLVLICRSHHEGYSRLLSCDFDPLHIPGSSDVVHRRYLACVLRLADILDVDPERTPPIIFRHRTVSDSSEVYWTKDQALSVAIHNHTVHLSAEPVTAVLHKAVELTADGIEKELQTCYRLSTESPFSHDPAAPEQPLPHNWGLQPYLHRRITPRHGAYEYIEGSFRPNSDKVLQLLGSQELYTTPLTAIRELLQNAFDGVRERIAITQLHDSQRQFEATEVANRFSVTLKLCMNGNAPILSCEDDGAGMTKDIIQDHFLVSGNSVRPDLTALARRCEEKKIKLDRTGQFGIGVLSYFLLAESIDVETRRAAECGDDDGTTWSFHTEGVGSFGELRRSVTSRVGTTVRLRLRASVVDDFSEFTNTVAEFVEKTIIKSPCRFRLIVNDDMTWSTNAGWTRSTTNLSDLAFSWMRRAASELALSRSKPLANKQAVEQQAQYATTMSAIYGAAIKSVVWHTSDEIDIDGLGACRIHVPSFLVDGEHAPYFMHVKRESNAKFLKVFDLQHGKTIGMAANDSSTISWKGMSIRARSLQGIHSTIWDTIRNWQDVLLETDLTSNNAGKLSLNREFLDVYSDEDARDLCSQCATQIVDFKASVAESLSNSPYAPLWYTHGHSKRVPKCVPHYWSQDPCSSIAEQTGFIEWSPLRFPATDCLDWLPHNSVSFRNTTLNENHVVSRCVASSWKHLTLPWSPSGVSLVCKNGDRKAIVPVWLNASDSINFCEAREQFGNYQRVATFPLAWTNVAGVSPPSGAPIWNANFPPIAAYRKHASNWLHDQCKNNHWSESTEALEIIKAALGDSSREAAIFLDCLRSPQKWIALTRIASEVCEQLWDRWAGQSKCIYYITHRVKDGLLETDCFCFDRKGCKTTSDLSGISDPGTDWLVEAH